MATYHFFTLLDSEMPHAFVVRHLIFCVVDAAFAGLIWFWPRWLLIPVGVLTVQQFYSPTHEMYGTSGICGMTKDNISWLGVLTLFGLTTLVFLLLHDEFKRLRSLKTCGT